MRSLRSLYHLVGSAARRLTREFSERRTGFGSLLKMTFIVSIKKVPWSQSGTPRHAACSTSKDGIDMRNQRKLVALGLLAIASATAPIVACSDTAGTGTDAGADTSPTSTVTATGTGSTPPPDASLPDTSTPPDASDGGSALPPVVPELSLIHISEPTRPY